jgi:hypothetical protein
MRLKITGGSLNYLIVNGVYTDLEEALIALSEFSQNMCLLTNLMAESLKARSQSTWRYFLHQRFLAFSR